MTQSPNTPAAPEDAAQPEPCETLTVILHGQPHVLAPEGDETILETAYHAGLRPPVSCLMGSCATCVARITEGSAGMRWNDALTPAEVAMGYVLTCQGRPTARVVTVVYED
jgi:3-ketosteroid 9alpha-monooxygenase subunit B